MTKRVLLEAPILTQSGYGEHSRLVYQCLKSIPNLEIFIMPLTWGKTSWSTEYSTEEIQQKIRLTHQYLNQCQNANSTPHFDMQIFVGILNQFEKKAQYSVCVTAGIETDRVSHEWLLKTHQGVDKIIVPSEHSKKVFVKTFFEITNNNTKEKSELSCACPVDVVPYPVKEVEQVNLDLNLKTDFNFLSVALLGPRKNLENSLIWFLKEFKNDKNVGLILKTAQAAGSIIDRNRTRSHLQNILQNYKDRKCKIYLLHGSFTQEELHSLYVNPKIKAYITATHGEGFGLPVFEAAYSGLPIVATDWSGHLDFLTMPIKNKNKKMFARVDYDLREIDKSLVWPGVLIEGSRWAYPTEISFRKQIRNIRNNYGAYKKNSALLKEHVLQTHNKDIINAKMKKALFKVGETTENKQTSVEDLPKTSIIASVYNAEKYIEDYLKDITEQTIFKEKCELVLVNANSPEREKEEPIINKYKQMYPENIKYFVLDEDPGIYETWNYAISKSTGEFITNANLDDRKSKSFIEILSRYLYENDDIGVVYTQNLLTFNPNETFENNTSNGQVYPAEEFSVEAMLRGNPPHCMPMWRKSLHDDYGFFDNSYRSASDWDFWLRCTFAGVEFKKYPSALGLYYFNPEGMSTNVENDKWKKQEEREIFKKYQKVYIERQEDNPDTYLI